MTWIISKEPTTNIYIYCRFVLFQCKQAYHLIYYYFTNYFYVICYSTVSSRARLAHYFPAQLHRLKTFSSRQVSASTWSFQIRTVSRRCRGCSVSNINCTQWLKPWVEISFACQRMGWWRPWMSNCQWALTSSILQPVMCEGCPLLVISIRIQSSIPAITKVNTP